MLQITYFCGNFLTSKLSSWKEYNFSHVWQPHLVKQPHLARQSHLLIQPHHVRKPILTSDCEKASDCEASAVLILFLVAVSS